MFYFTPAGREKKKKKIPSHPQPKGPYVHDVQARSIGLVGKVPCLWSLWGGGSAAAAPAPPARAGQRSGGGNGSAEEQVPGGGGAVLTR